jgi:hypothetical protein
MEMQARGLPAKFPEGPDEMRVEYWLATVDELEQDDMACVLSVRQRLQQPAVLPGDRHGYANPGLSAQRIEPVEFAFDRSGRLISRPMHAQAQPAFGSVDPVGMILGVIDEPDFGIAANTPTSQGRPDENR